MEQQAAKIKKTKHLAACLLSLLSPTLLFSHCSSAGSPPTAPVELPSTSTFPFPSTIGISVDKILSEEENGEAFALRSVGAGGEFSDEITIGAQMGDEVIGELDGALSLFADVNVPIGETAVSYKTTVTDGNISREIKMDFAAYDLDGDGSDESCSGHTGTLPICFRIWLDGDRFMAGVFGKIPTDTSTGAGDFRLVDLLGDSFESESASIAAVYDHADLENKSTDLRSATPFGEDPEYRHISLTEVGPAASAAKTLNMTGQQMGTVSYLGQWIEDQDYWTGRITIEDFGTSDEVIPCAQISTGNGADATLCTALALSVDGLPFNELPTEAEVSLPDDFPSSPTF